MACKTGLSQWAVAPTGSACPHGHVILGDLHDVLKGEFRDPSLVVTREDQRSRKSTARTGLRSGDLHGLIHLLRRGWGLVREWAFTRTASWLFGISGVRLLAGGSGVLAATSFQLFDAFLQEGIFSLERFVLCDQLINLLRLTTDDLEEIFLNHLRAHGQHGNGKGARLEAGYPGGPLITDRCTLLLS